VVYLPKKTGVVSFKVPRKIYEVYQESTDDKKKGLKSIVEGYIMGRPIADLNAYGADPLDTGLPSVDPVDPIKIDVSPKRESLDPKLALGIVGVVLIGAIGWACLTNRREEYKWR
jgi:hypothetical protein